MVKKALLDILSIDWSYFFPNTNGFDWSADEDNPIFYEDIWKKRCGDINTISKKKVLDMYKPSIPRNFWSIVTNKPKIYVADSHSFIWHFIKDGSTIWNIDAHHDCGYSGISENIHCGNWALSGLLSRMIYEYNVIYPKWREKAPEKKPSRDISISYKLPMPQEYDVIFVCRSSCWTPPWFDLRFRKFILSSGMEYEIISDSAWKLREPYTIEEAKKYC